MAILFQDDFNRANGAPGNGWTVAGTVVIANNQLSYNQSGSYAYRTVPTEAEYDCTVVVTTGPDQSWGTEAYRMALWLRDDANNANAYIVEWWGGNVNQAAVRLMKIVNGVSTTIIQAFTGQVTNPVQVLTVELLGTYISVKVNGIVYIAVIDADVPSGSRFRMYSYPNATWRIDDVTIFDVAPAQMYVVPSAVVPGIDGQELTVYGLGTNWFPGDPGAPIFTASAGTIVAQLVDTPTRARLTYNPPNARALVIITDPDTGRIAYLRVEPASVEPPPGTGVPPDLWLFLLQLAEALGLLIDPIAAAVYDSETLEIGESLLGYARKQGALTGEDTLASLLYAIEGTLETDSTGPDSVRHLLNAILSSAVAGNAATLYVSSNGTIDLQQVLDAIAEGGGGGGNEQVLEAIAAVSELLTTTLAAVYYISSSGANDLAAVLSAINALSFPDLGPIEADVSSILSKVDVLDGDGSTTLPAILAETQAAHSDAGTAATQATAAAISAGAAVVAIGLVEGSILGALSAQTVELNGAIAALGEALGTAIGGVETALAGDIAGVAGQVTNLQGTADAIETKVNEIAAGLALLRNADGKWPGLVNVDIEDTAHLTEPTYVEGECDGLILDVTTYPPSRRYWTAGPATNLQNAGFVAFVGPDAYMDDRQPLAFTHQAYHPISVRRPVGVVVQLAAGVEADATTWSYPNPGSPH